MIGRLLHTLVIALACFSVGSVLSAAGLGGYLAVKWDVNREKLVQILAVAQGIDLAVAKDKAEPARQEPSQEQASYEQMLEARAAKFRGLELREQALRGSLEQLHRDLARMAEEKTTVVSARQKLQTQLADIEKQATEAGWEQNRNSLQTIKPKQAKELLLQMLAKNEMADVVALLAPMTDSKRARIIAEFKTPEETEKIGEVLRMIRRGEPRSTAAGNVGQQLGSSNAGAEGVNR